MVKTLESYAGVPHLKGDPAYNDALKQLVGSTQKKTKSRFGGFSALFDLQKLNLRHPLLVATTDGVGTKLEIANLLGKHDTIGLDLVAMCVNDLVTCGAKPLFFLDYFATGAFDRKKTIQVIKGIARGCREAQCALVGGETAIMPGFYGNARYDLAGFSVGAVEKSKAIDGSGVQAGDAILGLESSGFHSNGYSLLRRVFTKKQLSGTVGCVLLTPTRIYVKPILDLTRSIPVHGIAHITGGGFYDNLPRILPKGLGARIQTGTWPVADLFFEVQMRAKYSARQMFHTFNMGIGMMTVIRKSNVAKAMEILRRNHVRSWEIGMVCKEKGVVIR